MPELINPTKSAARVVVMPSEKKCNRCGEVKSTSLFHRHSSTKDKLSPYCKPCANAAANKHYKKDPHRRWCFNIKRQYGITAVQYYMMLDLQGGVCAVCKGVDEVSSTRNYRMPIDHCHETGRVRGILCTNCNRAIGLLGDNTAILSAAIEYLNQCPSLLKKPS